MQNIEPIKSVMWLPNDFKKYGYAQSRGSGKEALPSFPSSK